MKIACCGRCLCRANRVNFGWYCTTPTCTAYGMQIAPLFREVR